MHTCKSAIEILLHRMAEQHWFEERRRKRTAKVKKSVNKPSNASADGRRRKRGNADLTRKNIDGQSSVDWERCSADVLNSKNWRRDAIARRRRPFHARSVALIRILYRFDEEINASNNLTGRHELRGDV